MYTDRTVLTTSHRNLIIFALYSQSNPNGQPNAKPKPCFGRIIVGYSISQMYSRSSIAAPTVGPSGCFSVSNLGRPTNTSRKLGMMVGEGAR